MKNKNQKNSDSYGGKKNGILGNHLEIRCGDCCRIRIEPGMFGNGSTKISWFRTKRNEWKSWCTLRANRQNIRIEHLKRQHVHGNRGSQREGFQGTHDSGSKNNALQKVMEEKMTEEQKKKRTGLKAIIAAGAICALAYASDKADLSDQVGKAYREVRDYVTDVFTVNAGEASNEYISQLNEEAVPGNYSNQIGKATILAMGYLPNNSKVDVINQAISTMPMEYQKGVIINSLDEMSDSMKAELFKNEIKDMAPTYRNDVLQEAVKLSIDDKGNEIKSVYEKMKDFIQDKANDLKKVF